MAIERTLSIIKPDAVAKNFIGKIYSRFEDNGLQIIAARMLHLSQEQAENFYAVHRERPFYKDLVEFMTSGPVMVQALEGENAIAKHRDIMGATDPKKLTPALFEPILRQLLMKTRCMALMDQILRQQKSNFSSVRMAFAPGLVEHSR